MSKKIRLNRTDRMSASLFYSSIWESRLTRDSLDLSFMDFFTPTSNFAVFVALAKAYGLGVLINKNEIAKTTGLNVANIERILKAGVQEGVISSGKDDSDKRVTLYRFNPKIEEQLGEFFFTRQMQILEAIVSYTAMHVSPNNMRYILDWYFACPYGPQLLAQAGPRVEATLEQIKEKSS